MLVETYDDRIGKMMNGITVLLLSLAIEFVGMSGVSASGLQETMARKVEALPPTDATMLITNYCLDCHDDLSVSGGLNLEDLLKHDRFNARIVFENLLTEKMPPAEADQPTGAEKMLILNWLVGRHVEDVPNSFRRISRYEFVRSVNDLLGIELDIAEEIPEDRGTCDFDTDVKIKLTKEMLGTYLSTADEMVEFAFPEDGFAQERIWLTNQVKESDVSYRIYSRHYKDGLLFSWTRANNGNNYSFFYDNFEPPVEGWYELTFDAAKLGDFQEDLTIQVYAGKYFYADDRPQPQRLLDVISIGHTELRSHTIRGLLRPGENVSVHCYSKNTWRQTTGEQGAYIKQLKVRGPIVEQWPPHSYRTVFAGMAMDAPQREVESVAIGSSTLQQIGGRLTVSSFNEGMEKEMMQDGRSDTFWHTRFKPDLATPPHFVIIENPTESGIAGLSYSTWSGGNGNGQVKEYSVYVSDNGSFWGKPISVGSLEVMQASEQQILFPAITRKRFLKFSVSDAVSLDGKSLASIGELDVLIESQTVERRDRVTISSTSKDALKKVIKRFAEIAFSSTLTDEELAPYYQVSLDALNECGDFVGATKMGLKSIICSHRFLLAPGFHRNDSYRMAADLARSLWLSVPDQHLLDIAKEDGLTTETLQVEVQRMLLDQKSQRMIHSFCAQWLNLRSFNKVTPSLKLYPNYDDLLNHYLPLETEAYISYLIQENLPIRYLVDSDFSILNQRLAQHYDMEGVIGQQLRKVSFTTDSPRGGLLTMGSVLKVTADGFDTSPILRGAWISKNIAGNTFSAPPENVKQIERGSTTGISLREKIEQHKNNESCMSCHKSIDPYGFALESFDATGEWRTNYRISKPHSGTFIFTPQGYYELAGEVDSTGEIGETKFDNVNGLKAILLSDHKKVAYNFAKKFFEYANGYKPTLKQRVDLYAMISDVAEECRIRDLIVKVCTYSMTGEVR